ncbi:MAG: hypothetical protein B7Y39_10205 [Bdellovibrio sp. 28-41-41]|nr:MAG: hypothetical protein B7Y39_10205 [Bdellovibrio sp. 28-41-41]
MNEIINEFKKLKIGFVTPWRIVCGNAEYAARIVEGLREHVVIEPIPLNFPPFEKGHFEKLVDQINDSEADIIHIQHEYVFFGQTPPESDRILFKVVKALNKPTIVTLHTVREDILGLVVLPTVFLQNFYRVFNILCRSLKLKIFLKINENIARRLRKKSPFFKAMIIADIIVLHSHVSATILRNIHPELASKIKVIPIPIATVPNDVSNDLVKVNGDIWLMMMGFVSDYKNHVLIVEALAFLPPNFKLIIVGGLHPQDTKGTKYWCKLLEAIDIGKVEEKVKVTGFIEEKNRYFGALKLADIFLMPYKEVGQSASAVLADIVGFEKPIVTSNAGSMFEYRYGLNTMHAMVIGDTKSPKRFADTIINVYEKFKSPNNLHLSHLKNLKSEISSEKISTMYMEIYANVKLKVL